MQQMNTTSPQQQATVDTKQLESLIEEGNSFFKVQKWNEAKQKYSLAIGLIQNLNEIFQQQQGSFKYLEQQWIRVHNNRAQVHLMLVCLLQSAIFVEIFLIFLERI